MAKKAKAVPRGYRTVTPYLIIQGAARAIDYYKQAFKAKVLMCLSEPNGKVGHAEIKIGDSRIMLADEYPETGSRGPQSFGGSPVFFSTWKIAMRYSTGPLPGAPRSSNQ